LDTSFYLREGDIEKARMNQERNLPKEICKRGGAAHDLMARIAVAGGTIGEMTGILQRVQHNMARWCRTCNEVGSLHFEQLLYVKQQ
jgi:hypothetical protein